jgi:hypothetical protein
MIRHILSNGILRRYSRCLVTGSRDSPPVCARTRSYSYAFPYCGMVSHPYFPSAHRGQRRYHVKKDIYLMGQHFLFVCQNLITSQLRQILKKMWCGHHAGVESFPYCVLELLFHIVFWSYFSILCSGVTFPYCVLELLFHIVFWSYFSFTNTIMAIMQS